MSRSMTTRSNRGKGLRSPARSGATSPRRDREAREINKSAILIFDIKVPDRSSHPRCCRRSVQFVDAPAGGRAGGVLGLDGELREVEVVVDLAFGGLQAVFQLRDPLFEHGDAGFGLVGTAGAG